ncbi:MAG: hypothetical protein KDB88_01995 [Flavobacteriales bacterium]|nr:hypothetical protein [Flavobacteriales bacterium]
MNYLKGITAALLLLTAPLVGMAQENTARPEKSPAEMAEVRTQKMTEHLGLSEEQSSSLGAINARYMERIATVKQQKEENREMLKQLHDAYDKEIAGVLTPEQYEQFKAEREARKEKMRTERKPQR